MPDKNSIAGSRKVDAIAFVFGICRRFNVANTLRFAELLKAGVKGRYALVVKAFVLFAQGFFTNRQQTENNSFGWRQIIQKGAVILKRFFVGSVHQVIDSDKKDGSLCSCDALVNRQSVSDSVCGISTNPKVHGRLGNGRGVKPFNVTITEEYDRICRHQGILAGVKADFKAIVRGVVRRVFWLSGKLFNSSTSHKAQEQKVNRDDVSLLHVPLGKVFLAVFAISFSSLNATGATKYIKADATGSANGTSWANAWTNFNQMSGIAAGDTIYISGGSSGLIYSGAQLTAPAQGVTNAPITLKKSEEAGHTGMVTISNNITGNLKFWVIDGSQSSSFNAPTNGWDIASDLSWTNNIGIDLVAYNAINYSADNQEGLNVKWVRIRHPIDFSQTAEADGLDNDGDAAVDEPGESIYKKGWISETCGIRLVPTGTKTIVGNMVFEHIYMTDISTFGLSAPDMTSSAGYSKVLMRYCYVTRIGDDPVNYSGTGFTFDSGVISDGTRIDGHGDGLQTVGSYIRVRNSVFWNMHNAHLRLQFTPAQETTTTGWQVYGNFFFETNTPAYAGAEGIGWVTYAIQGNTPVTNMYLRDFVFANNTVLFTPNARSALSMSQRDNYTNIYLTNFALVNNVFQENWGSVSIPWTGNNANGGFIYDETQFEFDYNIIAGPQFAISYLGDQTSALALNAATIFNENGTNWVSFSNTNTIPMDLSLVSGESDAIDQGKDLSGYGMDRWEIDLFGNNRLSDGTADVGAAEYVAEGFTYTPPDGVTNGLLVLLAFDEDFTTNSYVTDWSGNGNHAYKFGFPSDPNAPLYTNAPLRVATSTTPGRTGDTGYAGDFDWFEDGYGFYGRSGRYLAITNGADFVDMPAMTVMAWARYMAPYPTYDYTADSVATLVSAGLPTGTQGSWSLGRYNQSIALNETRFVVNTNASFGQRKMGFLEDGFNGNTTNWYHFAATFDAGTVVLYFNGVAFATNTINNATLTVGESGSRPYDWIGIGCSTHVGTPELEDETGTDYPNNGWMNGVIDDVRIYNRALVAGEVEAIFSGDPYDPEPPPPGDGNGGSSISGASTLSGGASIR